MEGVEQGTGSQTHRSQTTGSQTAIPESESPVRAKHTIIK